MWFCVNGFDVTPAPGRPYFVRSGDTGSEWPTFEQVINDAPSNLSLQIVDIFNQLPIDDGYEVIVWDENTPPTYGVNGVAIPTIPAMNVVLNPLFNNFAGVPPVNWTETGTLPSSVFSYPTVEVQMTFANNALGYALHYQNILLNYVKPGQQYMLSVYVTGGGTINNIQSIVKFDWYDIDNNLIAAGPANYSTPVSGVQSRISVSGTAPAGTAYAQVSFGGQTTVAGNNSGTITFTPGVQFEPMYFVDQGVSYPTPDCNSAQVNTAIMPDGTASRMCRVFSGYIDDLQWNWEGGHRLWTLSVASAGMLLDNGPQINMTVANLYDDQILTNVYNTYFTGLLSIAALNQFGANPIVRGILVANDTYSDKTFRDLLNGLVGQSGFNFWVDPYYTLHYNPQFYAAAQFGFSDEPDNITTFEMHDFIGELDATSRKRNIKIIGGNYLAPFVDPFTGDGSTSIFNLTWQPKSPTGHVTVSGSSVTTGVFGVHNSSSYAVLVDKAGRRLIFSSGHIPANGVAISYSYSFEAPVSVQVIDQDTTNPVTSPSYAQPPYYSQVHDSSIASLDTARQRGLAELTAWSKAKKLFTFNAFNYVQPGLIVYITSHSDNIINQPYVVTKVDASFLGNGVNLYAYTIGAYQPSITDYIRYAYKGHHLSSTTANVTAPQNIDIVFSEFTAYSEQPVQYTQVPGPPYLYGFCKYGFSSYG